MFLQTFENDIELRLELQFCIEKHCVFFRIFLHDGYVQKLAIAFKKLSQLYTNLKVRSRNEHIYKMFLFLSLKY
jgi:hypothetical protein